MPIIYDEPAHIYHANTAMTSSKLRAFMKSPQLYKDTIDGLVYKSSRSMSFGEMVHTAVLEPERWENDYFVKPSDVDMRTKRGKEWKQSIELNGGSIISEDDCRTISTMIDRMPASVSDSLSGAKSEVVYRDDSQTIQCRVDAIRDDLKIDLKTILDIDQIERHIWKYGYHIQEAWYKFVIESVTKKPAPESILIFCETNPPYRWRIVELSDTYKRIAEREVTNAYCEFLETKEFLETEDVDLYIMPPDWMMDEEEGY